MKPFPFLPHPKLIYECETSESCGARGTYECDTVLLVAFQTLMKTNFSAVECHNLTFLVILASLFILI